MRPTVLWLTLLVVGGAALLDPVALLAEERGWHNPKPPAPDKATVYEVAEWGMFVPPKGTPRRRQAYATLVGRVRAGDTFCPKKLITSDTCNLVILASDDISLTTGRGPVDGDFWVVAFLDNPVDGDEGIIAEGKLFDSTIDLSPALGDVPLPLGFLTGRWKIKGTKGGKLEGYEAKGTVTGTFQLPFVLPPLFTDPTYVIDPALFPPATFPPAPGCCEVVQPFEYSLGIPTVRLELSLVRTD